MHGINVENVGDGGRDIENGYTEVKRPSTLEALADDEHGNGHINDVCRAVAVSAVISSATVVCRNDNGIVVGKRLDK